MEQPKVLLPHLSNMVDREFDVELTDEEVRKIDNLQTWVEQNDRLLIDEDRNDHVWFLTMLAVWMAKTPGIKIGIASRNLEKSREICDRIHEILDPIYETKINNKDTLVYENDSRINTITPLRMRGVSYDVVLMSGVEELNESVLSEYMSVFSMCGPKLKVFAFHDGPTPKTVYFSGGFKRHSLRTSVPAPGSPTA